MFAPIIVEAVGRDLTLTGRTDIWAFALDIGVRRPTFGAGYRAFWSDVNTLYWGEFLWWADDDVLRSNFHGPDHGHSGLLDLWLEMGWIGCSLFVLVIASAVAWIQRCFAHGSRVIAVMFSAMLTFALIYSCTERFILQHSETGWMLFTALYFYAVRETGIPSEAADQPRTRSGAAGNIDRSIREARIWS
jgi:O-antigen ligase